MSTKLSDRMRIDRVDVRVLSTRYETEFRNPHLEFPVKHAVLVFVSTEQGLVGVGESWCDGGDPGSVVTIIESDLAPRIIGASVSEPERIWRSMISTGVMSRKGSALYAAASGIDIAIWDVWAQTLGQPLHRLLGGNSTAVPVYGSGGLYAEGYTPESLASDMAAAMDRGCCGAKIKVAGATLEEDVERAGAVRRALGSGPRLMVDALFKPGVAAAIRPRRALVPFDTSFYEAPTELRALSGWRPIRPDTGIPLSGPEVEAGLDRYREFLSKEVVDYLQADAIICGGVTELRRIAALGRAYRKPVTYHASGSAVALAANAQVAAALAGTDSIEMHLLHQALFERLWEAGWRIENGALVLPEIPGIGVDITPDSPIFYASVPGD
ncbi:MAG: mandelate racemase/muconate lactonizing enzyme family protein [Gammaproteobacteria bacterium]|nr:mandelate racemase/muconate lactonizing enzyme family protein [Gammaproteobacteria bacterium]